MTRSGRPKDLAFRLVPLVGDEGWSDPSPSAARGGPRAPALRSAPGRRRCHLASFGSLVVIGMLTGGAIGLSLPASGPNSSTPRSSGSDLGATIYLASGVCNSLPYIAASSLLIALANPVGTLGARGTLTVAVQFAVSAHTVNTSRMNATFPSIFATFPTSLGSQQVYFPPGSAPIPSSGWSNVNSMNKTITLASPITFKSGVSATLSTQKLAVMAPATYTTLTLEFRWSWSYHQPNGTSGYSGWSVPTTSDQNPSQLRSIFYPAPFVSLLSSNGPSVTIGTNYQATLAGAVSGAYFFLEMEFPSTGKVVQSQGQTATSPATTFSVFIPVIGYTHWLSPGPYLVHIHDACGAMLYSKSIQAVFAASATITFAVTPSACGVRFNGTTWMNGSSDTVVPSTTAYPMSVGCAGHSFKTWAGGGGVHVNNGTSLLVSANGAFNVVYT